MEKGEKDDEGENTFQNFPEAGEQTETSKGVDGNFGFESKQKDEAKDRA